MNDLFIGSAVSRIGTGGVLPLGTAFCTTIQSRAAREQLFVGVNAEARCMVVYDRAGLADNHRRHDLRAVQDAETPAASSTCRSAATSGWRTRRR